MLPPPPHLKRYTEISNSSPLPPDHSERLLNYLPHLVRYDSKTLKNQEKTSISENCVPANVPQSMAPSHFPSPYQRRVYKAKSQKPRQYFLRSKSSKTDSRKMLQQKKTLTTSEVHDTLLMKQLKEGRKSFIQEGSCFKVAPSLAMCCECQSTGSQESCDTTNSCRFNAFRDLCFTEEGQLTSAGFSNSYTDASKNDMNFWLPQPKCSPSDQDIEMAEFLLSQVGVQFFDLLKQEKECITIHQSRGILWKRVINGVREMCDICDTTIFNFHWICSECGFEVCIDCYKDKLHRIIKTQSTPVTVEYSSSWLFCINNKSHERKNLVPTQIIPKDCLAQLECKFHEICKSYSFFKNHGSPAKNLTQEPPDSSCEDGFKNCLKHQTIDVSKVGKEDDGENSNYGMKNVAVIRAVKSISSDKQKNESVASEADYDNPPKLQSGAKCRLYEGDCQKSFNKGSKKLCKMDTPDSVFKTVAESKDSYDVPHSWLCKGELLRLIDPYHEGNYHVFQDRWKRGLPVIISEIDKHINVNLWQPESFAQEFGDHNVVLIDSMTGNVFGDEPMRNFWDGFEHTGNRRTDYLGKPLLLKLKDWPPGDNFEKVLPSRFRDLMRVLPLQDYTHHSGCLNLVSHLPESCVRPDLGPKLYIAYGSAQCSSRGSTNLHVDMSDAVNLMVYVGLQKDGKVKEYCKRVEEIVQGVELHDSNKLPGALWHVYHPKDASIIRDFLKKVAKERGMEEKPQHDPIHDQTWYLTDSLRKQLYKDCGVEGYAFVQYLGDAVFIPAGAPHQVRNLHNCIKVAEDFVSPENVSQCFKMTQEFRNLSRGHSNHEDKLQIKSIVYHTVKDSLSVLMASAELHDTAASSPVSCSDAGCNDTNSRDKPSV